MWSVAYQLNVKMEIGGSDVIDVSGHADDRCTVGELCNSMSKMILSL